MYLLPKSCTTHTSVVLTILTNPLNLVHTYLHFSFEFFLFCALPMGTNLSYIRIFLNDTPYNTLSHSHWKLQRPQ